MIERLVTTLRALAALPATQVASAEARRLADDCADALRLELDCPQQALTPEQRAALRHLGDLLDADESAAGEVPTAASAACSALGLALPERLCSEAG